MPSDLTDDMEPRKTNRCFSNYDRRAVLSALQKAVRRGDEYVAAWAAWDLVRSGYEHNFWKHIQVVALDDLAAHDDTLLLIDKLKRRKGEGPFDTDLRRSMLAIKAAVACARAEKSREVEHAHFAFTAIANEVKDAVKEDREAELSHPDLKSASMQPIVYDRHTLQGNAMGRKRKHFDVESTRTVETTAFGEEVQEKMLDYYRKAHKDKDEDLDLTDEQKKRAKERVDQANVWDGESSPYE